jgi:hypothetical protein
LIDHEEIAGVLQIGGTGLLLTLGARMAFGYDAPGRNVLKHQKGQ